MHRAAVSRDHRLLRRVGRGRVAPGYRRIREIAKRTFQHTSGAKPFRHVGKDLGAALPANSDYPDHCRRVASRTPRLVLRKILAIRYASQHRNEMAQLVFDVAGCRNGVGNFLSQ